MVSEEHDSTMRNLLTFYLAGCNHITCKCGQSLCFICGEPAGEDHWLRSRQEGGCPRFNHPSRLIAIYEDGQDDIGPGLRDPFEPQVRARWHRRGVHERRNAVAGLPRFATQPGANEDDDVDADERTALAAARDRGVAMFNEEFHDANEMAGSRRSRARPEWLSPLIETALWQGGHRDSAMQQREIAIAAPSESPGPSAAGSLLEQPFSPPHPGPL